MKRTMSKVQTRFKNEVYKVVQKELLKRKETKTLTVIAAQAGLPIASASFICTGDADKVSIERLLEWCDKLDISVELNLIRKDTTTTVYFKGLT